MSAGPDCPGQSFPIREKATSGKRSARSSPAQNPPPPKTRSVNVDSLDFSIEDISSSNGSLMDVDDGAIGKGTGMGLSGADANGRDAPDE